MRTFLVGVLVGALVSTAACGGGDPAPTVDPPTAPAQNDPAFAVAGVLDWYVLATAINAGQNAVDIDVTAPDGTDFVDAWIAGRPGVRLAHTGDHFTLTADITDLAAGEYDIILGADGEDTGFARLPLRRTMPYFILMTTDWDFADPSQQALDRQDTFHAEHPELVLTHFVGPYTFTDPAVNEPRRAELVDWLLAKRDTQGDEIALHLHPYCNFVEDAGVTCITDQSTVYATDETGYTIKLAAYSEADLTTLFAHADDIFAERGLGKPTTFRAGGWTASIETLRALEANGYVADTSALNWARLEEWEGVGTGELYRWNMAQWAPIGDTSQPYYPNHDDILSTSDPRIGLLEVPDNGIMVDYVSVQEMIGIFDANWDGATPLDAPRTLMLGYHPAAQFLTPEAARVDGILDHVDQHLASTGAGPCIYVTLDKMPLVFPR
jgi:hypothetical protein